MAYRLVKVVPWSVFATTIQVRTRSTHVYIRYIHAQCTYNVHTCTCTGTPTVYTCIVSYPSFLLMETEYFMSVESSILLTDLHEVFHERAIIITVVGSTVHWSLTLTIPAHTHTCTIITEPYNTSMFSLCIFYM